MIWKISIAKEQISQVLRRNFLVNPSPNVLVLANGVNSNQTKSIFLVHTLDRVKYPELFVHKEKYISSFFDITCKNALDFATYNNKSESESDRMEEEIKENGEKDIVKIDEVLKGANQQFLDLIDERYTIIFLKVKHPYLLNFTSFLDIQMPRWKVFN